jgi:hypothetical protein
LTHLDQTTNGKKTQTNNWLGSVISHDKYMAHNFPNQGEAANLGCYAMRQEAVVGANGKISPQPECRERRVLPMI